MSIIKEARKLFRIKPTRYYCRHYFMKALNIKLTASSDCLSRLKKEGFIKVTFKDTCNFIGRKHCFYELKHSQIASPKEFIKPKEHAKIHALPKKINPIAIRDSIVKVEPTKLAVIIDTNKSVTIFRKAAIVEVNDGIVFIVEV